MHAKLRFAIVLLGASIVASPALAEFKLSIVTMANTPFLSVLSRGMEPVTITSVVINNRQERISSESLSLKSLPTTLKMGDTIRFIIRCDPIRIDITSDLFGTETFESN